MIEEIQINNDDKILIIAPHPDDECIGVGGVLGKYPEKCIVVVCTDGRHALRNENPLNVAKIRSEEFQKEMEYLGISRYMQLGIEDGTLMNHLDFLNDLNIESYTKIFFPHDLDCHPDHTAVYLAMMEKVKKSAECKTELYVYEVHRQLSNVTHYMVLDNVLEKKVELISFHKSQIANTKCNELASVAAKYRALQFSLDVSSIECYQKICIETLKDNIPINQAEVNYQKQLGFYYLLVNWMRNIQSERKISSYLEMNNIKKIAIYGYAELGQLLEGELKGSQIEISYIMDKAKTAALSGKTVLPDKELPKVDAVIVTAIYYYDEIKNELEKLGFVNVISLRDLVDKNMD